MGMHIFERANVLRYLRSIKTSQKGRYKEVKELYGYQLKKMKIEPNKKNLSKKEIKIINEKIRNKIIRERVFRNIIVASILLTLVILIYFSFNMFKSI